jgi:hypothetical protein
LWARFLPMIGVMKHLFSYRWWVPDVPPSSRWRARRRGIRFLGDPGFVGAWAYLVMPAFMAAAITAFPALRDWPALGSAAVVAAAWVTSLRARFAMAASLHRRRSLVILPSRADDLRRAA